MSLLLAWELAIKLDFLSSEQVIIYFNKKIHSKCSLLPILKQNCSNFFLRLWLFGWPLLIWYSADTANKHMCYTLHKAQMLGRITYTVIYEVDSWHLLISVFVFGWDCRHLKRCLVLTTLKKNPNDCKINAQVTYYRIHLKKDMV